MKCASLWVMAVAAAVIVGSARAETSPFGPTAPRPAPPTVRAANPAMFAPAAAAQTRRMSEAQRVEWRFLKDVAASGRFATDASRLALARSGNAGVRSFAATLVNHHSSVRNELVHMLHVRGMAPPMLGNHQRKALNRLAKLHGAKFDREFIDEIGLRNQQDDMQVFEKARPHVRDPRLKAWIERMLPTLRYHLTMAERLAPPDSRLPRGAPAASAEPAFDTRQTVAQPLTADPFVSRASLATRSMGGAPAPLGLTAPLFEKPSGPRTR